MNAISVCSAAKTVQIPNRLLVQSEMTRPSNHNAGQTHCSLGYHRIYWNTSAPPQSVSASHSSFELS